MDESISAGNRAERLGMKFVCERRYLSSKYLKKDIAHRDIDSMLGRDSSNLE